MVEERQKDGDALGGQRTLATSNGRLAFIEATEPLFLDWLTEPGASKKTGPLVKRLPVGPLREMVPYSLRQERRDDPPRMGNIRAVRTKGGFVMFSVVSNMKTEEAKTFTKEEKLVDFKKATLVAAGR